MSSLEGQIDWRGCLRPPATTSYYLGPKRIEPRRTGVDVWMEGWMDGWMGNLKRAQAATLHYTYTYTVLCSTIAYTILHYTTVTVCEYVST